MISCQHNPHIYNHNILNSTILWSLDPKGSETTTLSTICGLIVNTKSKVFSPLVGSLTCCVTKQSIDNSKNLLPFSSECNNSQLIVLWLKSPQIITSLCFSHAEEINRWRAISLHPWLLMVSGSIPQPPFLPLIHVFYTILSLSHQHLSSQAGNPLTDTSSL